MGVDPASDSGSCDPEASNLNTWSGGPRRLVGSTVNSAIGASLLGRFRIDGVGQPCGGHSISRGVLEDVGVEDWALLQ